MVRLPGGAQLSVTSANAARYVHLLTDYRLNRQLRMRPPVRAVLQGLGGVEPLRWIRLFASELQMRIGGIGGIGTSDTS